MAIVCIERVIVAVRDLAEAREQWRRAGFNVPPAEFICGGLRFARTATGAVEIDLCAPDDARPGPLGEAVAQAASQGGGVIGWIWGVTPDDILASDGDPMEVPGQDGAPIQARSVKSGLEGIVTGAVEVADDLNARANRMTALCGANPNTAGYLEHIVVMATRLEDAIAANQAVGVPCRRIREVGNGVRQAFFKLEQTVIEVVAPTRNRPGCWGLAFMCTDIRRAVDGAREHGLQATEPKTAVQGGHIARIVDPIDGVAIAFMQSP